jgi:hypothetical protein
VAHASTRGRLFGYATMLVATSLAIIAWMLMGHRITDPAGGPAGRHGFLQLLDHFGYALHGD